MAWSDPPTVENLHLSPRQCLLDAAFPSGRPSCCNSPRAVRTGLVLDGLFQCLRGGFTEETGRLMAAGVVRKARAQGIHRGTDTEYSWRRAW